jgi:hypothetical protein
MKSVAKPAETELLRTRRWASSAGDWDLARELDSCRETRDSCQRQIGLLALDSDQSAYDSLISRNLVNQQRMDVIELEITKRKGRL